jgi:uncharacterized coiled-coil protein SlyX
MKSLRERISQLESNPREEPLTIEDIRNIMQGQRALSSLTDKQLRVLAHGFPDLTPLTDEQLQRIADGESSDDVVSD